MRVYMMNKPQGLITAKSDRTRKTVMELFPPDLYDALHPIGRLDIDTAGLLLFTDDGRIDNLLMQPKRHVEKEYFFYAFGELSEEAITRLENGMQIPGEEEPTRPAKVKLLETCHVDDVKDFLPLFRRQRYLKNPAGPVTGATLTIHEGKKHQVKRMLRALDLKIFYLERRAVGSLRLDPALKQGEYRLLTEEEMTSLLSDIRKEIVVE